MGKSPSRVAKVGSIAWKRLADISTAAWLWSLLPSGIASVIAGWLAYGEGLPKSVVFLIAVGALAFAMILFAGWRISRALPTPATAAVNAPAPRARFKPERAASPPPAGLMRNRRKEQEQAHAFIEMMEEWASPSALFEVAMERKKRLAGGSDEAGPPRDWIPFHAALKYLVYDSAWGANQRTVKNEDEFNTVVAGEMRERLSRGEIAARGKRVWGDAALQRGTEEISTAFWVDSFFLPWGEIALAGDTRGYASKQGGRGEQWSGIIVDGAAMRRIWPLAAPRTDSGLPPLAAMIEETRATCERGAAELEAMKAAMPSLPVEPPLPEPEPGPAFQREFNYAYPKAVLRAELGREDGEKSARDGAVFHVGVRMSLICAHDKELQDCSVVLAVIEHAGIETTVMEPMKFGDETSFNVYPGQPKQVSLVARDVSDPITPAPFLIKLASREMPLAENSRYALKLELRSRYRFPTLVYVQIDTKEGTDLLVKITSQVLSETPL